MPCTPHRRHLGIVTGPSRGLGAALVPERERFVQRPAQGPLMCPAGCARPWLAQLHHADVGREVIADPRDSLDKP